MSDNVLPLSIKAFIVYLNVGKSSCIMYLAAGNFFEKKLFSMAPHVWMGPLENFCD